MNDWFEWNGTRCTDYGMHILGQPTIILAAERVTPTPIPGRSGSVTMLEGANIFDDIAIGCTCVIDDPYEIVGELRVSRISAISGWLKGNGSIKFANRQEGVYKGRVSNQIGFDKIVRGNPHLSFQVQFRCSPFLYLDDGANQITMEESPYPLVNPGNIPSEPLLKILGAGEGSIMCGSSTLLINSLDGIPYLMVDNEAKVIYKGSRGDPLDPLQLLGTRVTGNWLTIPVGDSFLTFTGGITSVKNTPRWRCV